MSLVGFYSVFYKIIRKKQKKAKEKPNVTIQWMYAGNSLVGNSSKSTTQESACAGEASG
jgi:hypothetical protein